MKPYKYLLPVGLILVFLGFIHFGYPIYFIGFLIIANLTNYWMGEFTEDELRREYRFFHEDEGVKIVQWFSAIFFLLFNIYMLWFVDHRVPWGFDFLVIVIILAIMNSTFTATLAHEWIHDRREKLKFVMGHISLLTVSMPFFANDHVYNHHRLIGTDEDITSPPYRQSIYRYIPAAFWYRIRKSYFSNSTPPRSIRTALFKENYIYTIIWVLSLLAIYFLARNPGRTLLYFLMQSTMAYLMYEISNYLQHYGLRREKNKKGYERISLDHSWNSYYKYTCYISFLLPIHSIHHVQVGATTKSRVKGPRLPLVYFQMMALTFIPPLFFRIMDQAMEEQNLPVPGRHKSATV